MSDLDVTSGQVTELVDLAGRFREAGRLDEAAELLLLALRLDPKAMSVKLSLAEVRKLQQQHGGGTRSLRDVLREGLRRNAIDAAHFLGLAHLYAEKGENARAIECLEVAKAKDLANPAGHKLHGRILFRRRDFDGAAEELGKALRLNPFDREIAEQLGRTEFERKQFEAALGTTVHAFLLLNDGDEEGVRRLRRRIQTLKQLLGWGNRELTAIFRERQELVHTAFERLEWHRERILEQGNASTILLTNPPGPAERRAAGGLIDLASRMRRLKPWAHFSDEQIFRLTGAVREEMHDAGSLIFGHKSRGHDLYVLERGEITIQRPTPYGTFTLGTLSPGDLFGEMSFITAHERSSDALATKSSHLLRINADALQPLIESSADLGVQLYWALWHGLARKLRGTNEQLRSFFASEPSSESFVSLRRKAVTTATAVRVAPSDKIKLFREQGLSRRELTTFAAFAREKRYPAGAFLFQEGDEGDEMYIVLEGRVIISKLIQGAGEEALAVLERGDFFGEMSLIDGEPRSADARAYSGPLTVLALDQATVREILAMDPHAALEFLQLLCRLVANRLREIDDKVLGWRILSGERNERVSA